MRFLSEIVLVEPGLLQGHVLMESQPERHWYVGLFVNGRLLGATLAAHYVEEGAAPGRSGDHFFRFNLNTRALLDSDFLRIEVLNVGQILLEQTVVQLRSTALKPQRAAGTVQHQSGLILRGTVDNGSTLLPSFEIIAMEDDRIVGRCRINRWEHVGDPQDPMGKAAGFDLHLDPILADGRMHRLHVETSTGLVLEGSPVDMVAWPNRFRAELVEAGSGGTQAHKRSVENMLDRLLGLSMPLAAYASLYPELEVSGNCLTSDGRIGIDGAWFRMRGTDWVLCCHDCVQPLPGFEARLAAALSEMNHARAAFCDLALRQTDGAVWPLLMPVFDAERLLEQGYAAMCFAIPETALAEVAQADSLVAFLLSYLAPDGGVPKAEGLWHLPHPGGVADETAMAESCVQRADALAAALKIPGRLPPDSQIRHTPTRNGGIFPALQLRRKVTDQTVSVIIPTRNQGTLLNGAIAGLKATNPGFDLDIIVVDNGSDEPESLDILNRLEDSGTRILEFGGGFNFSLINNLASEHARYDQLCFMNNDVAFPWPGVLEELCSRLADPTVGAVGPMMLRASDILQHGGVVLGPWRAAAHAFEDRVLGDPGYGELLCSASEPAAVTGAFLLTRRQVFHELGGFDSTRFAVNFNDVDYCLRLRQAGYRVLLSPHAKIRHYESVSRGRETGSPRGQLMHRELACLRAIWREPLLNDPQYHPLFAIDTPPYRALALEHRDPAPRSAALWHAANLPRWA